MVVIKKMEENFFDKWSPEMTYVLGFFAADGNLSINKRGGCYISFHSKDKQIILDIKRAMGSNNKVSKRINKINNNELFRLQIGSKNIVNDLIKMGFSTSKTKHLPFPYIPQKLLSHFVRGYFDGDGNIWKGEVHKERKTKLVVLQLVFTSGSYLFLHQLKTSLNHILGTNGSHVILKNGAFSRLQFSTKDALKIYNFMYNTNIPLCLKRKKSQFDKHIKNMRL
jgi:intein/homing endonuclease